MKYVYESYGIFFTVAEKTARSLYSTCYTCNIGSLLDKKISNNYFLLNVLPGSPSWHYHQWHVSDLLQKHVLVAIYSVYVLSTNPGQS